MGCGGWLIACVAIGLLAWFVALPRISDAFEDSVADGISTIIADQIDPLYSRSQLQQGADVPFSFRVLNQEFERSSDENSVEAFRITSRGGQLLLEAELSGQKFDVAFVPKVTSDGQLELEPVDDGGWWQRQFMSVLSGGFEGAVNQWLDRNDLRLTGVSLEGETLVLSVTGK